MAGSVADFAVGFCVLKFRYMQITRLCGICGNRNIVIKKVLFRRRRAEFNLATFSLRMIVMLINGDAMPLGAMSLPPDKRLPTLQRNALRKIFERHDFSPDEVFMLGYRRLQQSEGIGQKGIETITRWLKDYGFELLPQVGPDTKRVSGQQRNRRKIDHAMQLLRANGYVVRYLGDSTER
jgi:hypothetical protein